MPYGYEPLNYIPDYSFVARAGQQLGSAVQDFSDKWSAHKKELQMLQNNRAAADDMHTQLRAAGRQALLNSGVPEAEVDKRLDSIKPLSDAELASEQGIKLGLSRIEGGFKAAQQNAETEKTKRGETEYLNRVNPKPVNVLPGFSASLPEGDLNLPSTDVTPPSVGTQEEALSGLSAEARKFAMDDPQFKLLPENEDVIADKELARRSKNLAAQKTEAEVRELNRRASGPRSSSAADRNADTNAARLEETKRVNRIKDLDAQIKAKKDELDKKYGGLPEDEDSIPTKTDKGFPFWPFDNKQVPDLPAGYKDVNAVKGDISKAGAVRKELADLEQQRRDLSAGGTVATLPGAPARKPSKPGAPVDPAADTTGLLRDPDVAQAKRLLSMPSDGKGKANPHYKPNPTPADIQAMVARVKLARSKRNAAAAAATATTPAQG